MVVDFSRALLRLLLFAHLALLLWLSVPEITACSGMELPVKANPTDLVTARDRVSRGTYFYLASFIDVFAMVYIVSRSERVPGRHDLRGYSRLVPGVMLASTVVFRARYKYCTPNDPECCGSLNCPTTSSSLGLSGCPDTPGRDFPINWNDRKSWCAMPSWYKDTDAATVCGGLAVLPDVASCYRYGCSSLVPVQYYGTHMIMWSSIVFAILALVPYQASAARKAHAE